MNNYLDELNEAQKAAVISTKGASLVIAGAGSGKTRVLTYRIAHLLSQGVPAFRILALTFTNKAANEMKDRIASLIGYEKAKYLWMGTFHSIFAKILRREATAIGFPSSFTIYDTQDSKSVVKSIIKELKLDDKTYKVNEVFGRISSAKNNLITPAAYENNSQIRTIDRSTRKPEIYRIYKIYVKRCFNAGAMDFDDLLLQTNILFRDKPEILEKYQQHFQYLLVDEYQDTNYSQYLIVKKLAEQHNNVCVVGDDAQSIYSFRGAKIENILNFRNDYPDYSLFKLEQNYRSTQNIVNAANSIIEKNTKQIQKKVFSEKATGDKIKIIESLNDTEEGYYVANAIIDGRLSDHYEYSDFAILYRTNAQSRIFEEALRKRNIPYKIYGGLSFYQRKEVKDLLAYCRLIVNTNDNEAFKRIINYPRRGIGLTSLAKIESAANENDVSLWEVAVNPLRFGLKIGSGILSKIKIFIELISYFFQKQANTDAYELVHELATATGILKELRSDRTPEGISRYENIQELLNGIKEYVDQQDVEEDLTLANYLEEVSLLTTVDQDKEEDFNKVTLMTVHSAKGLEFKNVYIVGMEEDLFPSQMTIHSKEGIEEERRLFYVAVTRAMEQLVISHARQRFRWGSLEFCSPSRFIDEIDESYVENFEKSEDDYYDFSPSINQTTEFGNIKPNSRLNTVKQLKRKVEGTSSPTHHKTAKPVKKGKLIQMNTNNNSVGNSNDNKGLEVGMRVEHQKFGYGTIKEIEGSFPNTKATIEFDSAGVKKILLKFAKLRKL